MVVRKYLVDTNIFLEILLLQSKQQDCKNFIKDHFDEIAISQFTLNSIGVCCYRNKCFNVFINFLQDIALNIPILTLDARQLQSIENVIKNQNLDYDDSYQFITAQINNIEIVTLDTDFKKVDQLLKILFI